MFKIEKNVAMPARTSNHSHGYKYPVDNLEVGDSFLVPYGDRHPAQMQSVVCTAIKKRGLPMTFTTRQTENGLRVWRVA